MELSEIYRNVDTVLNGIDFADLFPGFCRYRFALYNEEAVCLDGEMLPWDERFRGNTAISYDGEYIAIWNMGIDPIGDTEVLASSLVHEMFHCHQYTLGETRFPADLRLLQYPDDIENYERKYHENCLLADAYEHSDPQALGAFAALRRLRFSQYPEMLQEEWKTETCEGMAEYAGLKALERINAEKFKKKVQSCLQYLRAESPLQFDIRRISYNTGTVFLLCLDRLGLEIKNDMGSTLTVYEQNPVEEVQSASEYPCEWMEAAYARLISERKAKIEEHLADTSYTECDGEICGYDPMNMFRCGDLVYCSHFVMLRINGEMKTFPRRIVLALRPGSDRTVRGYY